MTYECSSKNINTKCNLQTVQRQVNSFVLHKRKQTDKKLAFPYFGLKYVRANILNFITI